MNDLNDILNQEIARELLKEINPDISETTFDYIWSASKGNPWDVRRMHRLLVKEGEKILKQEDILGYLARKAGLCNDLRDNHRAIDEFAQLIIQRCIDLQSRDESIKEYFEVKE